MNRQGIFKQLFESFPNSAGKVTETTVAMYYRLLRDIPDEELQITIDQCIAESRFLPTIAEIRERWHALNTVGQLTATEAWEQVTKEIKRIGSWGAPQFDNEITKRAVDAMGWINLCQSDVPGVDRAQFHRIYDGLSARGNQAQRMLPASRQLAERKAIAGPVPIAALVAGAVGEG